MVKICMITSLDKAKKRIDFKSAGGMATQVPILKEGLEKIGFEVTMDEPWTRYDILHIHDPFPTSFLLCLKARKDGKKVIVHARHLPELLKGGIVLGNLIYPIFKFYSKLLYNLADVVICPTPYVRDVLKKEGVSAPLEIIPNGINCKKFFYDEKKRKRFRKKYGFMMEDLIVFSIGLMIPRKGIIDFMKVAERMDELKFAWIGSSEPGLEKVDVANAAENVHFLGYIPFDEIADAYSGGDIFFFPTYAESYGNALFEAAACGRPIVIRDIEIYKWLKDGEECLKGKTIDEYARCISRIIEDENLYKKLSENAVKIAKDQDIGKSVRRMGELYTAILAK
jgi:1,2-diacylglycerol-3-alpha-glucose alpha-1,2-glucosyltransferase